jgi:hypothetical protein
MFTREYLGCRAREAYTLSSSPHHGRANAAARAAAHRIHQSARPGAARSPCPPGHARPTRAQNTDDLAYHLTAHLRLNAVYWGLTALSILGQPGALDREELVAFVLSCWDDAAGARARSHGP